MRAGGSHGSRPGGGPGMFPDESPAARRHRREGVPAMEAGSPLAAGSPVGAEARGDPVREFAERLRRLQADCGGPSVRELERLTGKVGAPYTRGTIQDKLTGRSVPAWEFVEAFVRACALHSCTAPDLRPWRGWHAQLVRELAAQRAGRRRAPRGEVCPYRGLEAFTAEHTQWFCGRAGAVQHLLAALAGHRRAVLLLGPSGAGKSSL